MHHNDNQQLNFPKLPKICVIGPQSSGKSTVLARLLGHDIFPIGNNLTTKCVIEIKLRNNCTISCYKKKKKTCVTDSNQQFNHLLKKLDLFEQLNRINSNSCDKNNTCDKKTDQSKKVQHLEEYAVFDDMPDKIIPIENVKQEIITRMNQKQPLQFESDAQKDSNSPLSSPNHKLPQNVTKKSHAFFSENLSSFSNPYHNLNISRKVIKVTVFLHNILPLTLVDTPGIIHIPKFGQNQNMALLSKAIAREYIQKCDLILSIINGSVDLVNSESLSLIKSEGCLDKTIGVLTKIDLGLVSEIEKILTNKEIPLRHGYFGLMSISSSGFLGDLAPEITTKEISVLQQEKSTTLRTTSDTTLRTTSDTTLRTASDTTLNTTLHPTLPTTLHPTLPTTLHPTLPTTLHPTLPETKKSKKKRKNATATPKTPDIFEISQNSQLINDLNVVPQQKLSFLERQALEEQQYMSIYYPYLNNIGIPSLQKYLSSIFEIQVVQYFSKLKNILSNDYEHLVNFNTNTFYKFRFIEKWLQKTEKLVQAVIKETLYNDNSFSISEHLNKNFGISSRIVHGIKIRDLNLCLKSDSIFLDEKTFLKNLKIRLLYICDQLEQITENIYKDLEIKTTQMIQQNILTDDDNLIDSNKLESLQHTSTQWLNFFQQIPDRPIDNTEKSSFFMSLLPFLKKEKSIDQKQTEVQSFENQNLNETLHSTNQSKNQNDFLKLNYHLTYLSKYRQFILEHLKKKKTEIFSQIRKYIDINCMKVNLKHNGCLQINENYYTTQNISFNQQKSQSTYLQVTNEYLLSFSQKYYETVSSELVNHFFCLLFYNFSFEDDKLLEQLKNVKIVDNELVQCMKEIIEHT